MDGTRAGHLRFFFMKDNVKKWPLIKNPQVRQDGTAGKRLKKLVEKN